MALNKPARRDQLNNVALPQHEKVCDFLSLNEQSKQILDFQLVKSRTNNSQTVKLRFASFIWNWNSLFMRILAQFLEKRESIDEDEALKNIKQGFKIQQVAKDSGR